MTPSDILEEEKTQTSPEVANGNGAARNGKTAEAPEAPVSAATASASDVQVPPEANGTDGNAPAPNPKKPKRRGLLIGIGAIALLAGGIFGARWWQFQATHVSTDNAQIQGHISPIAPQASGRIQKVLVQEGQYVKAGQLLIQIDDRDYNLQVQQAQAALQSAEADARSSTSTVQLTRRTNTTQVQQSQANLSSKNAAVNSAQAQIRQAEANVATAQAKVTQAQTDLNRIQTDLRRYEALYQEGAIPAQQLDTQRAAARNAQASVAAAQQQVAEAQAGLGSAQAAYQQAQAEAQQAQGSLAETQVSGQKANVQQDQAAAAQAKVAQARAALAQAQQNLRYTRVIAPVSGYVGKLTAQVGQNVQAGQSLLSITPLDANEIYVLANFKETALNKLAIGETAHIEADAYPGRDFQAKVVGISPATGSQFALIPQDNANGNFTKVVQWVPVRLEFDPNTDPQHLLRAGLSVNVTVDTQR